jgi:hypothetical protein
MSYINKIIELHENILKILEDHLVDNSKDLLDMQYKLVISQNVTVYQLKKALMTAMFIELEELIFDFISDCQSDSERDYPQYILSEKYEYFKMHYDRLIKLFTEEFEYSL